MFDLSNKTVFITGIGSGIGLATAQVAIKLGARVYGTVFSDFVMYNYSEANVDKIEGYMAHKFGLESTLPSDHTYKNSAPTISNA